MAATNPEGSFSSSAVQHGVPEAVIESLSQIEQASTSRNKSVAKRRGRPPGTKNKPKKDYKRGTLFNQAKEEKSADRAKSYSDVEVTKKAKISPADLLTVPPVVTENQQIAIDESTAPGASVNTESYASPSLPTVASSPETSLCSPPPTVAPSVTKVKGNSKITKKGKAPMITRPALLPSPPASSSANLPSDEEILSSWRRSVSESSDSADDGSDAEPEEASGWTESTYRILFSMHIPALKNYHSMQRFEKEKHWDSIVQALEEAGVKSTRTAIQSKFRNMKARYYTVKDNNSKTGRAPMRFQYYELMDEYFKSSGSAQVQLETVDAIHEPPPAPSIRRGRQKRTSPKNLISLVERQNEILQEYVDDQKKKTELFSELISILKNK